MRASSAAGEGGLKLIEVSKTYPDSAAPAVSGLNLEIEPGEFLALLGPSGSGKTTTLSMIAGLDHPSEGEIRLGARSLISVPPERREIGMVFQSYALFPHMTAAANVAYPLRMRRVPKRELPAKVAAALQMVGLAEFADRFPDQLSGGQQQRVALARALVFSPQLLLMDEPLGALDKQLRGDMQREIRQIHQATEVTVLYVTHDQGEALAMADRIAVMNGGDLEQVGPPQELYSDPASRFVASFIGECNLLDVEDVRRNGDGEWLAAVCGTSGLLSGPGPAGPDSAKVMVRPHHLELDRTGREGVRGRAINVLYQGSDVEILVELADGQRLIARRTLAYDEPALEPGSELGVSWPWAAARLV